MTNLDTEESKTIRNLLTDGDLKPTDKPSSLGLDYMLLQKWKKYKILSGVKEQKV